MKKAARFALISLLLLGHAPAADWAVALGSPQGEVPVPPGGEVRWHADLEAALVEARASNRPLLVTWRCLPCKQCSAFDKDVLEGGSQLSPLLRQFVTVRMTDAAQLDERLFPYAGFQDLDLSWWGYFLSPEGRLYAVFGGKDHVSDTTRISTAAFANTMRRVLDHHYDPRREAWGIDGPAPDLAKPKRTPRDLASHADYQKGKPWLQKQDCLHCHQVNDLLNTEAIAQGSFDLKKFTQAWPLPENVGIHVDRDHGLLVTKVDTDSPAAKLGLQAGDQLAMAAGRKLFGQADFRGVLHRADYAATQIEIAWHRGGELKFGRLQTAADWRAGQNAWRKSVYEGVVGPHLGFFPLKGPATGKGSLSIRPFMGQGDKLNQNPWFLSGLRPDMEIVEINGRRDDWDSRQLIAWFRLNHQPGETVTVKTRAGEAFSRVLENEP